MKVEHVAIWTYNLEGMRSFTCIILMLRQARSTTTTAANTARIFFLLKVTAVLN